MDPVTWLIMFIVTLAVSFALAPKPQTDAIKPAGVEDLSIPTAADKPIQVFFGRVRVSSPNVLWSGEFRARRIYETRRVDIFNKKRFTTGYKYLYSVYMSLGFGDPTVRIHAVWDGKRRSSISGMQPDGAGNGDVFTFGNPVDAHSKDMLARRPSGTVYTHDHTTVPAGLPSTMPVYPTLFTVWIPGMYIGTSPQIPQLEFEVSRYPMLPGGDPGIDNIDNDANPAYVLYEFYTNTEYGLGMSESLIDKDSFQAAAYTLFNERLGISGSIEGLAQGDGVIKSLLKHMGGVVRQNLSNGKYELKLVRADYDPATIPVVDQSMIVSLDSFARANAAAMSNEIQVKFRDRDDAYKPSTITAQNLGAMQAGRTNTRVFEYTYITRRDAAELIAGREMRANSTPVARARITCNRKVYKLNLGDVFKLEWPKLGISSTMRVIDIDAGVMDSGKISITALEDVYGLDYVGFSKAELPPPAPPAEPLNVSSQLIIDAPRLVSQGGLIIAGRNDQDSEFTSGVKLAAESEYTYSIDETPFTQHGLLQASVGAYDETLTVDSMQGTPVPSPALGLTERQNGANLCYISDGANSEWISFDDFTESAGVYTFTGVWRGLMGTPPKPHGAGAEFWFMEEGRDITAREFAPGDNIDIVMLTSDNISNLELADATVFTHTLDGVAALPVVPGNLLFDGEGDGASRVAGTYDVTWASRTAAEYVYKYDDPSAGRPEGETYNVVIRDSGGSVVINQSSIAAESLSVELLTPDTYSIEISASDSAGTSPTHSISIVITA